MYVYPKRFNALGNSYADPPPEPPTHTALERAGIHGPVAPLLPWVLALAAIAGGIYVLAVVGERR